MPLTAGERLGPYEIRARIAAGGMGEVYSAYDTRLRRSVAVKIVRDASTSTHERARLEREAQAAAALSHPNILSVFDVGNKDGVFYIVTELLEGRTLREELAEGPLPLAKALAYAREAAIALRSAHAKGVVHRDIKPENLFITFDGRLKVLDFGLARLMPMPEEITAVHEPRLTAPHVVVGTAGYMSPEQLRGEAVDPRSDIFSLGCVLFEMLGGHAPFARRSLTETMAAVLNDSPDYAALRAPSNVLAILRRCLAKNPSDRYATAEALAADLGTAPKKPQRSLVLPMAAAALVIVAVVGAILIRGRSAPPAVAPNPAPQLHRATIAVLPFQTLGGDPSQEYFTDGLTEDTTTEFGRISPEHLAVIARTSTLRYRNAGSDVRTIGRQLGADYIVEGSVRRNGDRVRVAAQLVRASDGTEIWADTYDRTVNDIFAMQSELARDVASAVQIKVVPARAASREKAMPKSPAGRDAFLRGRYHLLLGTQDDVHKAIDYLSQAVAAEPDSPLANVELAEALMTSSTRNDAPRNVVPRARAYVEKALRLDDSVAEAHELMAEILLEYDWKWPDAEGELKRAIALDPNLARSYVEYGTLLVSAGRIDEGLRLSARAAALDPVGTLQRWDPPYQLYVARRWSDMIAEAHRELDLDPRNGYSYAILGLADLEQGNKEDALRAAEKTIALTDATFSMSLAAYVDAGAGRPDIARDLVRRIEKISETRWVCFFNVGAIYAALGEKDKAFAALERAFADRSG